MSFHTPNVWVERLNNFGKRAIDGAMSSIQNVEDIVSSLYNEDRSLIPVFYLHCIYVFMCSVNDGVNHLKHVNISLLIFDIF